MHKTRIAICIKCKKHYKIQCEYGNIVQELTCECGTCLIEKKYEKYIQQTACLIIIDDEYYINSHLHIRTEKDNKEYRYCTTIPKEDQIAFKRVAAYQKWYALLLDYNKRHSTEYKSVKSLLSYLYSEKDMNMVEIASEIKNLLTKSSIKHLIEVFHIKRKPGYKTKRVALRKNKCKRVA